MMRIVAMLIVVFGTLLAEAAEVPAGSFGDTSRGLSVALLTKGDDGQPVIILHNDNPNPVSVQTAFAWLLLAESRDVAFYSDKIPLDTAQREVPQSGELHCPIPMGRLQVHPYQKGIKVIDGYPQSDAGAAARPVNDVLATPFKAQVIAFIPAGGERIVIRSKPVILSPARPASTQPADLAGLLDRFRHDAFAARDASELAARKGPAAIPLLLEGLRDPAMPDFGQMWLAAALTRIGGDEAAKAAVGLVDDPREGVRDVIAFHGPTMRHPQVDAAIIKRARSNQDALFTAWAARGFAEHGRPVPQGLVLAALQSSTPRARAEVAEVLAISTDPADAARLAKLFADGDELVRVAAADAVARHPQQPRATLAAMVAALERPGDAARSRIVAALAKSAGREWQYVPDAPAEQNSRVLQQIQAWWKSQK